MTSILSEKWFKTSTIIIQKSPLKGKSQLHSVPHLVLLINDGSMEIYEFGSDNTKINHVWSFKVPHQKEEDDPKKDPLVGSIIRYNYPGYTLYIVNLKRRNPDFLHGRKKGYNCFNKK